MSVRLRVWTVLLSTICAVVAQAEVIYDNGGTLLQGGLLSTVDTHFIVADSFVLDDGNNTITDIHWWGYYAQDDIPAIDSFTAYIYSDAGGAPGAVEFVLTDSVLRTDTNDLTFGTYNEFEYQMDISALGLTAGVTYWLALQNDVDCNWFWSVSDFAGGDAHQKLQNWTNYQVEEAFYLTGPAPVMPEPASIGLLGVGLAALGLRKKLSIFSRKPKT